ncbi:MAG: exosortase-associated EpsI family protein, partial [Akkermansiaceae bacterium]|nr:exosortase-associated EpsI family protein [Akkermansiaceae bacterium]
FPNAATDPQTGMRLRLPESIPGYQSRRIEPRKLELKWLPPDTGILKRYYSPIDAESDYEGLFATLILSGNDPRSLHKPEVCLDGQGWRIPRRQVVSLEVNGRDLEVMDFTIVTDQKSETGALVTVEAHYVYWWIGKDRSTPRDWDRIIYSDLDNLLRNVNNRWGYPSVMVYVDPSKEREQAHKEAQERAYDFIRNYAPVFQKSLSDPPASSGSPAS